MSAGFEVRLQRAPVASGLQSFPAATQALANSAVFLTALEAVLEVLPLSARYTGFDPVKAAAPAASDFEAQENRRRLALAEQMPAPKQLELVLAERAEAS
jgi:hypothetical protein